MPKSYKVPALISMGLGVSWVAAGSLCVGVGVQQLKGRGGVRVAMITFGTSLAYLGVSAIDGGVHILKEEGVLR
jgi:hypothetical protein